MADQKKITAENIVALYEGHNALGCNQKKLSGPQYLSAMNQFAELYHAEKLAEAGNELPTEKECSHRVDTYMGGYTLKNCKPIIFIK